MVIEVQEGVIFIDDNYLLTENEVFTGNSQTETLPFGASYSEVNTGILWFNFKFSRKDLTFEVNIV